MTHEDSKQNSLNYRRPRSHILRIVSSVPEQPFLSCFLHYYVVRTVNQVRISQNSPQDSFTTTRDLTFFMKTCSAGLPKSKTYSIRLGSYKIHGPMLCVILRTRFWLSQPPLISIKTGTG
ncbi:hypothetical protein VNO77_14121 [Canavalia gladiata]|uniref:Uncharacterized protein n=1 Tax=Canavalia gladiata TaxID=3824 RepID=A0AAN9LYI1_CANGL